MIGKHMLAIVETFHDEGLSELVDI